MIAEIRPFPDSIVPGFDDAIEVRFDEPVNLPNDLARRVFVSPMEDYEVEEAFSSFKMRPREGWRDSVVYCLTIPGEGISDLIRNRMEEVTEFCFSTGPPITNTRITGTITDAITGLPQNEARVVFFAPGDSTPYGAITDQDGAFSARALPPGEYQAFGFIDQNRNYVVDRDAEAHDSVSFEAVPGVVHEFAFSVVPPDTTPPVLLRADAVDSITVQVEFDDYLINPWAEEPIAAVRDSATGRTFEVVAVRLGEAFAVTFPGDTVAADSIPADSTAADTAGVGGTDPDSLAAQEPVPPPAAAGDPAAGDSTTVEEEPRPTRFVSLRLGEALDSAAYIVSVDGVVNLRRLEGGGDTTFVANPAPVVVDSAQDSTAVDSAAVDSLGATLDTLPAATDTVGAAADTLLEALRARRRAVPSP